MERVLRLYAKPYNVDIPVVCLDETTKQLIADSQEPYVDTKGVLRSQALKGRIGDPVVLKGQAEAWARNRNKAQLGVDWQFTVEDARIKLKRLYPVIVT